MNFFWKLSHLKDIMSMIVLQKVCKNDVHFNYDLYYSFHLAVESKAWFLAVRLPITHITVLFIPIGLPAKCLYFYNLHGVKDKREGRETMEYRTEGKEEKQWSIGWRGRMRNNGV